MFQQSARQQPPQIAGQVDPTVSPIRVRKEFGFGQLGFLPIPARQIAAADGDLARLIGRGRSAILVQQEQFLVRDHSADGNFLPRDRAIEGNAHFAHHLSFGGGVALGKLGAFRKEFPELFHVLAPQFLAADQHLTQAGQGEPGGYGLMP